MAIAILCFMMAAINVLFIVACPPGEISSWIGAAFCSGLGVAQAIWSYRT